MDRLVQSAASSQRGGSPHPAPRHLLPLALPLPLPPAPALRFTSRPLVFVARR
jgi:hypothetical protein